MTRRNAIIAFFAFAMVNLAALVWWRSVEPSRQEDTPNTAVRPTLYCEFYNFMRNATVVSFAFAVGQDGKKALTFDELFVVEPDGTKTDHSSEPRRWSLATEEETTVISSPDLSTRILLYGMKAKARGVFWTEAGIRSNTYRNLEGKCRQAHLDRIASASATTP